MGMKEQLKNYISECTIFQQIKLIRMENWDDIVDHHLYSVSPLSELLLLCVHCQKMNGG